MTLSTASDALEALGDLYFAVDAEDGLLEWNHELSEATGYDTEALAAATPTDFVVAAAEDAVSDAIATTRTTGEASVEADIRLADGSARPYEFDFVRLDDGVVAVLGWEITTLRDHRESMQNRERVLRAMYDVISDTERSFEEQVRTLLMLGREELGVDYGTLSCIEGEDYLFEVVHSADDAVQEGDVVPVSATHCEIVATDEQSLVLGDVERDAPEETHRTGYAEWGITCYLGAPVFVEGEVYGTFCFYDTEPRPDQFSPWHMTLVDLMSRWVGYELQRRRDTERLRRQNEKLDRFAAIVSHDLRNPLNVLDGSLSLAADTGDEEHFERANRAAGRMEDLIDDLLVLARAGDAIEETEPVDFASLARQCWGGVDTNGGELVVAAERVVQADKGRLRQLLENLIRNAIEHGRGDDDNPVTVTVGDTAEGFYVADDGVGIPVSERGEVFDSGYSTRSEGTGFGLSIVEEIAEAHGWTVTVTEGDDGGARFEFGGVDTVDVSDGSGEETAG